DVTIEAAAGDDALLIVGDAALIDLRERIAALALRHRLPTVSSVPEFTDVGALIGYGPSRRDFYRRAATYVKKILDGAKPADLPVEQPTLIELSINMQTARALGVTIPDSLLALADRVIEWATVLLVQADRGCHAARSRSIALRVVIIFRMTATMMTLDFLSAAARRLWKALRAGL